ncbi:hypothetical protein G6F56_006057 [Rhizopus delemar]|uniref:HTH APSES-type domain-containing protein n=1 Tax=Rhizopus stolonifer TaxID=4846 RepID=A0A367J9S0_RHIST|nr:hypothetical protein G6F56_006057 [Rhizopus delemar]RCH86666.1 hypothetical protein CU098_003856 [Rhizopus stolonifer]
MAQQKSDNFENKSKREGSLNVPIHPDDAKDKVFTAIMKALVKMENKPSSPKELANIIVKHKYATLGGATPFATVSSRISQHFKRAAEHNPPRAPLLAKHIDQHHSRKISYSLATESVSGPIEQDTDTEDEEIPRGSKKRKASIKVQPVSDSEHSDFHEEMFQDTKDKLEIKRPRRTSSAKITEARKPSFSFNSGFPGEQELWTPFSFEHDFENVFIHDPSTAHHIPFNIATPESIPVSELDDYFTTPSSGSRSQRKSFSSAMLGPNDKSLLQKVLLASAARGVADKIEEETKEEINKEDDVVKVEPKDDAEDNEDLKPEIRFEQCSLQESVPPPPSDTNKSASSSSLMNVENSEDFVSFEEDEKKETTPTTMPTPILPAPPNIKRDILPLNTASSAAALSASELLKSMNIQNINLPALQQMTSNLHTLQQLSPTFDLAKTMAVYLQSLTKSVNTPSASSSSSTTQPTVDIKSILSRFPVLEALLRKDINKPTQPSQPSQPLQTPAPVPPPPPAPADTVPNLVDINSSDPVIHTLTPTTPAMYITIIENITICTVVLEKTETTPEFRIMRRLDTGFINGTCLLAAGGIETESERSMILSFEMDRVRMPKKKSPLFGTWIPLRRAQELAITCSVQHKLGHFLEDSIEAYFPSLPIRKPGNRLTALALAALRSDKRQELMKEDKREESDSESHEEEAGSDTDVKNMLAGSALQELLSRASLPHPTHIHPKDLQKKKRRTSLPELPEDNSPEEPPVNDKQRKRSGGKWPTHSGGGGGKLASYGIKKSASTGGNMFAKRTPAGGKRNVQKKVKEEPEEMEEMRNMVVEHTTSSQSTRLTTSDPNDKEDENEEDEDIDIGGSDFDDDLR